MATSDSRAVILDSSVWVAFLYKEDSQHEKAKKVFETVGDEGVVVPEYVLIEVASALKRKKYLQAAKDFLQDVLSGEGLFLPSEELAYETARVFSERKDRLSFVDTALLVLSRRYRVVTFDTALARAMR